MLCQMVISYNISDASWMIDKEETAPNEILRLTEDEEIDWRYSRLFCEDEIPWDLDLDRKYRLTIFERCPEKCEWYAVEVENLSDTYPDVSVQSRSGAEIFSGTTVIDTYDLVLLLIRHIGLDTFFITLHDVDGTEPAVR